MGRDARPWVSSAVESHLWLTTLGPPPPWGLIGSVHHLHPAGLCVPQEGDVGAVGQDQGQDLATHSRDLL